MGRPGSRGGRRWRRRSEVDFAAMGFVLAGGQCARVSGRGLVVEEGFVAQDAVEGGAADGELAGGAQLVAAVEVKDVLDVMVDDGVE